MDMMKESGNTYKVARVARTTATTTTLIGVHDWQKGCAELDASIKLAHLPPGECERPLTFYARRVEPDAIQGPALEAKIENKKEQKFSTSWW
jgi:hypothetical protein